MADSTPETFYVAMVQAKLKWGVDQNWHPDVTPI
jgi:hypothetical protein